MSAADELARRDARFREDCEGDYHFPATMHKEVGCPNCHGLGYIPLTDAALLLACVEWLGKANYDFKAQWNAKYLWRIRLSRPFISAFDAPEGMETIEAFAAAVLAAMDAREAQK